MFDSQDKTVVAQTPDEDPRESSELSSSSRENNQQQESDNDPTYHKEFDIEVGTTLITDEVSGVQQSMYKATITEAYSETADEDVTYLGEHPAEAILGAVEKSTGGVV